MSCGKTGLGGVQFGYVAVLQQHSYSDKRDQFGQWTHAHDVPVGEDIIYAFHNVPYPPEMETILAPHKSAIQHLISLPRLENMQHLPAGRHLQQQGIKPSLNGDYPIKYCGDLTAVQQAQVAHWIFDNFEEARETVAQWLGCAPFAHALSIMLACNKCSTLEADPDYPRDGTTDAQEEFILDAAWTTLLEQTGRCTDVTHTDVDLECLSVFEQRLFEKSAQSVLQETISGAWMLGTIKMVGTHMLGFHLTGTTMIAMREILIMMKMSLRCCAC
jgi:hypothetical protein